MTETSKHQLDELSVTDILSYIGARISSMEEYIRWDKKHSAAADEQLTKAIDLIKIMKHLLFDICGYIAIPFEKEVNDFLKEADK